MAHPAISIIVPVYNVEQHIARCLESLVNQTFGDIEIICINDGSPDNSLQICEDYAKRDPRIVIFSQTNQGLAAARNTGLLHARGEFIQFCDSDDYYDLTMCEKMYNVIVTSKADLAVAGVNLFYDNVPAFGDEEYYRVPFCGMHLIDDETFRRTNVYSWNKIFKKSLIDLYKIAFPYGLHYEDACFLFKYLMVAKTIYYVKDALYTYVCRPDSIMAATRSLKPPYAIDHIYIINDVARFMETNGLGKKFEGVFTWMTLLYTYLSCLWGGEQVYRKAFEAGADLLNNIDYNATMGSDAAYNKDDVVRLYALKKHDLEMYSSVDTTNVENERVRGELNQAKSELDRTKTDFDKVRNILHALQTETADVELKDKSFFPYLIKSCFFFPWYIYKTYRMVYNHPVQKRRIRDLIKAYLFMPYFVLKIYRTILRKSEFLG